MISTKNPYTRQTLKQYKLHTDDQIKVILENANSAFNEWKLKPINERTKLLSKVAKLLIERQEQYAQLITEEMGKPISQSLDEIKKCAWVCDFYVKNAEQFLADELIETDADESFISNDPMGTILAVMPWNYPFWQVIRFAVPTLTAGNTVVFKHASNVTGCGLIIEELFKDAGYPEDSFQILVINQSQLEPIIANPNINGVTLTGSEKAGREIAAMAGKHLKKSVLELGGNNACVIWEDADLQAHIKTMVDARMQNTGQSCIAAKRFIVVNEIYDDFLLAFKKQIQMLRSGNPLEHDTEIGVMAREDLADTLDKQIRESVTKGAKVTQGNSRKHSYFEPTILEDVACGMPAFDEELFGPAAAVVKANNREDSLKLAKDSRFGLGTMLFTRDLEAAKRLTVSVPDGSFFINDMVKSHPQLPFGGTKASGYGRELSKEGILEFVNKKTVYIKK